MNIKTSLLHNYLFGDISSYFVYQVGNHWKTTKRVWNTLDGYWKSCGYVKLIILEKPTILNYPGKNTASFTPIWYQWTLKLFHVDTLQNQVTDSSEFWMSLAALDKFDNIVVPIQQIYQLYEQWLKKLSFLKDPRKANTEQQISTVCHFSWKLAALCIFREVIFPSSSILTKW